MTPGHEKQQPCDSGMIIIDELDFRCVGSLHFYFFDVRSKVASPRRWRTCGFCKVIRKYVNGAGSDVRIVVASPRKAGPAL